MRIEWTDKFSVGVELFDEHHKHLIGIVNDLLHHLDKGAKDKDHEIVKETLAKLIEYMDFHCKKEEEVLVETEYPYLEDHTNSHKELNNRLLDYATNVKIQSVPISLVTALLQDWLVEHILKIDKEYGSHLNSKGIF